MESVDYKRSLSLMSQGDSERVQFFMSCRNLRDVDTITVTDSFLVMKLRYQGQQAKPILRTKTVWNNLNPDYYETAVIEYEFQVRQILTFEVYHDSKPPLLVGSTQASVGEIFGSRDKRIIKPLLDSKAKDAGKIVVRCEVVPKTDVKLIEFDPAGFRFPDMRYFYIFGGTSPFFKLQKRRNNENFLVYESEVVQNSRNPKYKTVKINERKLCDNDQTMPIHCQVFNYSSRGNHDLMGEFFFTLSDLRDHNTFDLTLKKSKVGSSQMIFSKIRRYRKYDFSEFISAGLQMQLVACIDFTGSNGVATRPESLHYTGSSRRTAYEEALKPVGEILMDYDADKMVPLYGFGAKVRMPMFNTQGAVHHCFPINGQTGNPEVFQLEGLLSTYRGAIKDLEFSGIDEDNIGPTIFAPLLRQAMIKAKQLKEQGNQYMIVMILTDGEIHDMRDACHELIQCSRLPISVIVVGIGNGDFKLMEQLDDDDMQMTDKNGNKTERDLVQFVPFREYNNDGVALAKHVLEELPRQVVQYHELCHIEPQTIPRPKSLTDVSIQKLIHR